MVPFVSRSSFQLQLFCERWIGNVLGTWLEPAFFFFVIASCGEETDNPFSLGILRISDRIMHSCNSLNVGILKSSQRSFLVFSSSAGCHKNRILCHGNFPSREFLAPPLFLSKIFADRKKCTVNVIIKILDLALVSLILL